MKRQPMEQEKTSANAATNKGLITQTHKQLIQLNNKNTNHPTENWAKDLNRLFSKQDIQMANRHMKRCSILLIINANQKIQQGTTPVRMATIRNSTNSKCWRGCGGKGPLLHCWRECKLEQSLWKANWKFLRKLKRELPDDPAVPLLGTLSGQN